MRPWPPVTTLTIASLPCCPCLSLRPHLPAILSLPALLPWVSVAPWVFVSLDLCWCLSLCDSALDACLLFPGLFPTKISSSSLPASPPFSFLSPSAGWVSVFVSTSQRHRCPCQAPRWSVSVRAPVHPCAAHFFSACLHSGCLRAHQHLPGSEDREAAD